MSERVNRMSKSTWILGAIGLVVIVLPFLHFSKSIKPTSEKVWREDLVCLNATCVIDTQGLERCIEFRPQVVRVLVSPEPTPSDQLRMNLMLLGKSCSTE